MTSPFHQAVKQGSYKSPFHETQMRKKYEEEDLNMNAGESLGRAAYRGIGKALSNILERSAFQQEEASLPALLGMKPDVSTERAISSKIKESLPRESTQAIPNIIEKGLEVASDPASWLGGPGTAFAMGAAGETVKQLGAPKWAQVAAELAVGLAKPGSKKTFTDKSPEVAIARQVMKERGFAEKEITLATNAMKERGFLEKAAKMTKGAEQQIESTKGRIEKTVNEIVGESFPGFEKGIETVEKEANKLFEPLEKSAKELVIQKPDKFVSKVDNILDDIRNTLANSPDESNFIKMLETAKNNAVSGRSADTYINFYRTLNRVGKWVDPSKKERYMSQAKDAIKATFRDNGPFGNKLANELETSNAAWSKFKNAEEVHNILKKSYVDEAMDFTKLRKSLSNENNYRVFQEALGKDSASSLKLMADIGKKVEKMAKNIEGGTFKQLLPYGKIGTFVKGLINLDPVSMASAGVFVGGIDVARRIATEMLINPKFQNIWVKIASELSKGNVARAMMFSNELVNQVNQSKAYKE